MAKTKDGLNIQYNTRGKTIVIKDQYNSIGFKGTNTHETLRVYSNIESACGLGSATFETIGKIIVESGLKKH
ncbi:hypothetical protein HNV12_16990 [Methanococcoides sp. SA1]|nr:hypothetical protein [Methanococcoides sp. SA1]